MQARARPGVLLSKSAALVRASSSLRQVESAGPQGELL